MTDLYTYKEHDRSRWPNGPWDDEPDKVQWIDPDTDLDCLAVRNGVGAWCGYVGVGPEHPWHGIEYFDCTQPDDCDEEWCYRHTPEGLTAVHGGLTYSDSCQESAPEATGICHIPQPGRPDPVWWFGFDCCHAGDAYPNMTIRFGGDSYKPLAYVRQECRSLAAQLAAVR